MIGASGRYVLLYPPGSDVAWAVCTACGVFVGDTDIHHGQCHAAIGRGARSTIVSSRTVYDIPPGVTPPPPDSVLRVPSEMVKDGHRVRAGLGRGPFVEVVGTSRFTARTGEVLDVWIDLADGTRLRHGGSTLIEMVNPAMADAAGRYPLVLPTPDPWDDDQEETA